MTTTGGWQRLHPLSPLVRAGRSLLALLVLIALTGRSGSDGAGFIIDLVIVGVILLLGTVSWLVTRWRLEEAVLRIDTGLIRRSSRRFPLQQVQAVDIVEPFLARLVGLAELRVRAAGSSGTAGRLAFMRSADAQRLRADLLARAARARAGPAAQSGPVHEEPDRPVTAIDNGRLVGAVLLSGPGLVLAGLAVALLVLAAVDPGVVAVTVSGGVTVLLGVAGAAWRRLNGAWSLRVAETADGYHVHSGLLQTAAETIPFGRVQGVQVVEPLLWRPFGWCRLEVDVAGRQRGGRENDTVSRGSRALLPVGTRQQAEILLAHLVPGVMPERSRPPKRARWKSPLRYHNLSWGSDASYAVTTSGRVRRVTAWVPFAKVQSIRLVEGPIQRSLGLGTIHLDVAGRSVHAALRDRRREECDQLMTSLPESCREARSRPDRGRRG